MKQKLFSASNTVIPGLPRKPKERVDIGPKFAYSLGGCRVN